jgi:hypothetical protein
MFQVALDSFYYVLPIHAHIFYMCIWERLLWSLRYSQDKSKTTLQNRIVEKIRTDSVEDVQDISEAEEKFSDKPYEAFNEVHTTFRRRARAEQPDSFASEVDKLLGDREKSDNVG